LTVKHRAKAAYNALKAKTTSKNIMNRYRHLAEKSRTPLKRRINPRFRESGRFKNLALGHCPAADASDSSKYIAKADTAFAMGIRASY
jgi:hypothetical protein